jgi:hypothetical protein
MVLATIFETVAFLLPDWAFYTYGLFGYGSPVDVTTGFYTALPDLATLVDIIYIPIVLMIVRFASDPFKRLGLA